MWGEQIPEEDNALLEKLRQMTEGEHWRWQRRQEGQPQAVCAISWKAQQRLQALAELLAAPATSQMQASLG